MLPTNHHHQIPNNQHRNHSPPQKSAQSAVQTTTSQSQPIPKSQKLVPGSNRGPRFKPPPTNPKTPHRSPPPQPISATPSGKCATHSNYGYDVAACAKGAHHHHQRHRISPPRTPRRRRPAPQPTLAASPTPHQPSPHLSELRQKLILPLNCRGTARLAHIRGNLRQPSGNFFNPESTRPDSKNCYPNLISETIRRTAREQHICRPRRPSSPTTSGPTSTSRARSYGPPASNLWSLPTPPKTPSPV